MRFLLFLIFVSSTPLLAAQVDKDATLDFYERVLSCKPLTLSCLKEVGLIYQSKENLFIFHGHEDLIQPDEWISAERMAAHTGLQILLQPSLPGLGWVPVFDAVVFSKEDLAIANLSLKAVKSESLNGMNAIKRNIFVARQAFQKYYRLHHLPETFGFSVTKEGLLVPNLGTPDQKLRNVLVTGAHHLLGISKGKRRKAWLMIDFAEDSFKKFSTIKGKDGTGRVPYKGTFLHLRDSRQKARIKLPQVLNLDSLVKRSRRSNELARYFVFLNHSVFRLDRTGHEIIQKCEALLNN
ncbi:MAG: hypothetical protein CL676_12215 [Bdellovibrionaceae bacterium]|nr:hypothetical protein [Pseudobdellovibrionaceae bacterium]|tara:strand:+ start:20932 stop:21816 length:885 start_codon:yes stop_codon:yes gene_type:complete